MHCVSDGNTSEGLESAIDTALDARISEEASDWALYTALSRGIPSLFTSLLIISLRCVNYINTQYSTICFPTSAYTAKVYLLKTIACF